jgi:hypothetical protein
MSIPVDTSTPSRAARLESSTNSSVHPSAQMSLHNGRSDTNIVLLNLVVYLIKILSADCKFDDIINMISIQCGLSSDVPTNDRTIISEDGINLNSQN